MSLDSVSGVETRLRAGRSGVWNPARANYFSLLQNVYTGSRTPQSPLHWVPGFFPGSIAAGAWSLSAPSSAKVKNEWSHSSAASLRFYDVDGDRFTFDILHFIVLRDSHRFQSLICTCRCFVTPFPILLLVLSPWASLGRNQSPVRRQVWFWYAATWASS